MHFLDGTHVCRLIDIHIYRMNDSALCVDGLDAFRFCFDSAKVGMSTFSESLDSRTFGMWIVADMATCTNAWNQCHRQTTSDVSCHLSKMCRDICSEF